MECDVFIIGAGSAGLSTALECSRRGLDVIIIEKCKGIGYGIKTSGHTWIGEVIRRFGFPRNTYARAINSLYIHSISLDDYVKIKWDRDVLCTLNPTNFYQHLTIKSVEHGAKILLNSKPLQTSIKYDKIHEVKVAYNNKQLTINPKIVVDASGYAAVIAREYGLCGFVKNENIGFGIEYEMANVDIKEQNTIEYYTGYDVIPISYAWIGPKSKNRATVGMATIINSPTKEYEKLQSSGKDIYDCFTKFQLNHPIASKKLKNAQPLEFHYGFTPLIGVSKKVYDKNILLVGDSASQASPLLGEGLRFSLIFGQYAGEAIFKAIKLGKSEDEAFNEYQRRVDDYLNVGHYDAVDSLRIETDEYWNELILKLKKMIRNGDKNAILPYLKCKGN